jgi:ribosome biogenesis GTPase
MSNLEDTPPQEGLIAARHGANLAVEDVEGRVWHCLARRHIGHPVCGDRVVWQVTGPDQGVVTAILPRSTVLSRPDYGGRDKPLAANLTQLAVLVSPRPEPNRYLVDQYLVAAELMGVSALLVCTKMDLLASKEREVFLRSFGRYRRIGYPVLAISVRDGGCLADLRRRLEGETSILVGQSGVGKSSLVKVLLPDKDIQIGRLSKATGLGRHTTSTATCYRLPGGGRLIDSPGVRSFRLGSIGVAELEKGFRELAPFLGHCRFTDCRHDQEPGCALKQAVSDGLIHPERLATFMHMTEQSGKG